MKKQTYSFSFETYESIDQLKVQDADLLKEARKSSAGAYAPYSKFKVAAVASMRKGKFVCGTNQENASFPAGICAERVLLSTVSSMFPDEPIETIAISYQQEKNDSSHPIAPCGICRQSLQEYEKRFNKPIRLILSGLKGKVYIIAKSGDLMPLAFSGEELA